MATNHTREPEDEGPLREGEFRRIRGIGPGIEQRLRAKGINTFAKLAALSPEEIAAVLNGMVGIKPQRIEQQDWAQQAKQFADQLEEEHTPAESSVHEVEEQAEHQRYESFLVELLLEDDRSPRRTRVTHVRSGEKGSWAGWEPDRLFRWIASQADLPQPTEEILTETNYPGEPAQRAGSRLSGKLLSGEPEITPAEVKSPSRFYAAGEPFTMHLLVDMSQVQIEPACLLEYHAMVKARRLGEPFSVTLGSTEGIADPGGPVNLTIPSGGLDEGFYRLEVAVTMRASEPAAAQLPMAAESQVLNAMVEGGLIQIYAPENVQV